MGVVYEAEDTRLGRKVAIKFLPGDTSHDTEAVQRFLREARVISNLNHPHICTLFDIGSTGSNLNPTNQFMVMELLDGQSLKDRIARGPLPLEEVVTLGAQMADALDAAHAQGVVHRDIKPANLFVTRRGTLKVLDFGVAKLNQTGRQGGGELDSTRGVTDQLTTLGTTIGTVSYMSPEQARGQEIDGRSDLFSAGVVLYEMATGQLPFTGATVATIFEGLLTREPAPPSDVRAGIPPEFDHIVRKALDKDKSTRYQGAAELRADLRRLKRAISTSREPVAPKPAPVNSGWRRWIGAPIVLAALVGAFFFYRSITTPALTAKDTVVLASVVNRTGDTMFDDTMGEALALQLRQSPFLNVVPDQQVQATLRLMAREPMTPITEDVGREICQRAGAKALLGGSIAMLGSSYVVTLNAQDCVEGKVFAEQQAQAGSKETVLAALGSAVSAFREKLGETLASVQRYDVKIEEASTPSLNALKAYSQGTRTRRTIGDFDSVPFFRHAIDLDPEFALAYARLGTVYANLSQPDEARKMTAKAYELRNKVSEAERLYIEARYYTTVEPDLQKALDTYRVWAGTYPNDYTPLANSAILLKQQGNIDEALRNQEAAARIAPDQPIAWANLGDTYLTMSRFADAKKALETALKLQDSAGAHITLFVIGTLTGDQALADAQIEAMRGKREEVDLVGVRMQAAAYRGRMKEAAMLATEWQARMDAASRRQRTGEGICGLAITEALFGLVDQAKARIATALEEELLFPDSIDERLVLAAITRDGALARELLPQAMIEFKKGNGTTPQAARGERALQALAEMAEGKPAEAIALLEPITFDRSSGEAVSIWTIAQMQVKNWPAALKGLEFMTSEKQRQGLNATTPFAYASLARAQVELGQKEEARKRYQKFFDLWKDADPDLPLLIQAREEFSKL
jgi:tetratricopeptide (TPR) repeat protein